MENLETRFCINTSIIGTEEKTFAIIRNWDDSKPICVILELYPTITIKTNSVEPMDISTLHLLTHLNELGRFGSLAIINLFATVYGEKPHAKDFKADEDNIGWIESYLDSLDIQNTTIVLAYGSSYANNSVVINTKLSILELLEAKGFNASSISVEAIEDGLDFAHPLYLGLRHGSKQWKLEEVSLKETIVQLQYESQKDSCNNKGSKGKKRESQSSDDWAVVHGKSADVKIEHRNRKTVSKK